MPDIGDDGEIDIGDRFGGEPVKNAWRRTNEDMEAIASQREEAGWDTVTIPALDTAPLSRDAGSTDLFGIVHVIPGNHVDAFSDAFERGTFPRYESYCNDVSGRVFGVTELTDPDSKTAILIAGQYERRHATGMVAAAEEEGALFTHVKTLDGTILGSFRHDEYEPLIPWVTPSSD